MRASEIEKLTPAMRHYVETKQKHPDAYLFYRLGDFYELFFDDAIEVSRLLDLTLTKKSGGLDEKIPMCGVPFRVANQYLKRLVKKGYSVSVCDQVEDPKEAKGLVKREITKIVTPGTFLDQDASDEEVRYLSSIVVSGNIAYAAHCDYASGKINAETKAIWNARDAASFFEKQISLYRPVEVLYREEMDYISVLERAVAHTQVVKLRGLDLDTSKIPETYPHLFEKKPFEALALLIAFLEETQFHRQDHLYIQKVADHDSVMDLSETTIRNLELVENNRDSTKEFSLYAVLDLCTTRMGSRKLRADILKPLMDRDALNVRYDKIDALHSNRILFDDILEKLKAIYDIDRLSLAISNETLTPKQIIHLQKSLKAFSEILDLIEREGEKALLYGYAKIDRCLDLIEELDGIFIDDPPASYQEQRFIREGYDEALDRLFSASEGGKRWILLLEEREKEATGIKNLKIKYNKILGYFFEVSKSNVDLVPDYFIRKQTLVGSERFFTQALKEKEEEILHAKERAFDRQLALLEELRRRIAERLDSIQRLSECIASLDVTSALALAADRYRYTRPSLNDDGSIRIYNGRHPVVERSTEESYIPNDTSLDRKNVVMQIITGPNMAGKSTYMRQVALIQIMAQIGSFVPCDRAELPLVDQIFTRIGASDYLTRGQSTFMVEMTEVAEILKLATSHSLILFDEVGRGTSTYDGLSIAWAIIEYIHENVGAKTLFATHYFELTELADHYDGILNVTVATEEIDGEIRFLRKLVLGESNYSFGIDVAKLAGVKLEVIERARNVLRSLEEKNHTSKTEIFPVDIAAKESSLETEFYEEGKAIIEKLRSIDINTLTPLEALILLQSLKEEVTHA